MSGILDRFSARHPKLAQPLTSLRSLGNKVGPKRLIKWLGFKTARKLDDTASHFQEGVDALGDVHTPNTYSLSTVQKAGVEAALKGKKMKDRNVKAWAKGGMTQQRREELAELENNIKVMQDMLKTLKEAAEKGQEAKEEAESQRQARHDERVIKLNRKLAKQVLAFPLKRKNAKLMRNVSYSQQVHGVDRYGVDGLQARCDELKKKGSLGMGILKQAVVEMHGDMLKAREQAKVDLDELKQASKGNSLKKVSTSQAEVNRLIAFFSTIKILEGLMSSDDAMEGYLAEHGETLGLRDTRAAGFNTDLASSLGIDLDDVAGPQTVAQESDQTVPSEDTGTSSSASSYLDEIDVEELILSSSRPTKSYGTFSQASKPAPLQTEPESSLNPSWNTGLLTPTPASPSVIPQTIVTTGPGELRRSESRESGFVEGSITGSGELRRTESRDSGILEEGSTENIPVEVEKQRARNRDQGNDSDINPFASSEESNDS